MKTCFHTWQVFLGSHLCDFFFFNLSHKTRGSHRETSDNREVELITEIAQQMCGLEFADADLCVGSKI